MLVHLSSTSPYICDVSLGSIEQANRMSSAICKKPYLEMKESFPRLQPIRTPLKLLAPDEVPMNTSVATTTTDIDTSRQPSLQPVWYTEQTIVDDNIEQQRNSNYRPDLTRSTLPTIESNSPEIEPNRPSLVRKSSTFTMDPQSSIEIPSPLNDSGKENMITSTQQEPKQTEESFRRLEHLLGLGSANINLTMTTTAQESPKCNHESLSLTVVTPTEIINQTTNSLHLSYAPACGSLPSSQNILLMPTIESITEPSINSTMPPPFTVDNSDTEEPSSTVGSVLNQDSYNFTDRDEEEEEETPKDDTDDFSFELNDFASDSKDELTLPPPPPPMITIRAPTSADVAYRALVKPRPVGRISQPIKAQSPLVKTLTARASVPNLPSRVLRSSTRRVSTSSATPNSTIEETNRSIPEDESFVNEVKTDDDDPCIQLVEVVSLSEDEDTEPEQNAGITLNLTESKELHSASITSAEEADRSASSSCSSYLSMRPNVATPTDPKMPVLSREFTFNTPTTRITTRASERRRSILISQPSSARATQSLIPTIPEQQQQQQQQQESLTEEENASICSIPSSTQSTLLNLSTNPTTVSEAAPIILQKSLVGSASPSPNPTPIITIRPSERLSSNFSPRRSINPLHSSTPSIRNKSLQIVSIGEQEQLSTTAPPQQLNIDLSTDDVEMVDSEQQIDISIPIHRVVDEGIQTSPEKPPLRIEIATQTTPTLDPSSRRRFQTMEQQTTPIVPRSSSCQTTPMEIDRVPSEPSPSPPPQQQENTPLHTKAIIHLRRNVRFQFTPSTDARLAAKEKLEEEQRHQLPTKQEIQIITDTEREEDTEDEMKKTKKKIPTAKKKKIIPPPTTPVDDSSEEPNESPVPRTTRKRSRNDTEVVSITEPTKKQSKRPVRNEKKVESEVIDITTTTSPPAAPAKRVNRKRSNPKTSTTSPPETTSPTEPVPKRSKTLEVEQPVLVPSPEPASTRSRSKTPETVELPPIPKKSKKRSAESHSNENKRKNPIAAMKKGKRRLHSVEQDEGLNTADEEETIQTISIPPPEEIKPIELSQEERTKIEGLTVAELKNRLNTHGENIPKGARKADLVALLIKIETNLLQEQKEVQPVVVEPPARKTRRKK